LVARAQKEEARRFESWVCDEVLPTLRKTGSYNMRGTTATITQQLGAHKLRLQLIDRLAAETDKAKREAIHQQLAHASDLLGVPTPALGDLGPEVRDEPWLVEVLEYCCAMCRTAARRDAREVQGSAPLSRVRQWRTLRT
jgi:hypothetical protein